MNLYVAGPFSVDETGMNIASPMMDDFPEAHLKSPIKYTQKKKFSQYRHCVQYFCKTILILTKPYSK